MPDYAASADVVKLLPGKTLGAGTKPSTGDLDGWCTEATNEVDGALAAKGIPVQVTATRGVSILKKKVVACVAARTKFALADGTPVNHENLRQEAEKLQKEWDDFLAMIRTGSPAEIAAMLGVSTSADHSLASSTWTNHPDPDNPPPEPAFTTDKNRTRW